MYKCFRSLQQLRNGDNIKMTNRLSSLGLLISLIFMTISPNTKSLSELLMKLHNLYYCTKQGRLAT